MRIVTPKNQFGNKEGISAIAAIIRIAQYVSPPVGNPNILLMGLSKACRSISRSLLWAAI